MNGLIEKESALLEIEQWGSNRHFPPYVFGPWTKRTSS